MNTAAQRELASVEYWDKQYVAEQEGDAGEDGQYDWYRTFNQLRPFFDRHLPTVAGGPRILQLGCGMSTITVDFYKLGYQAQVSIDFSPVAIEAMEERHKALGLQWQVMDVRKMDFHDAEFDLAVDKGTLDAMLHGSLWDPDDDVRANVGSFVDEVARVLKPGGRWLCITFKQPHFLKPLLQRQSIWDLQVEPLEDTPGTFEYFGFIMTKKQ